MRKKDLSEKDLKKKKRQGLYWGPKYKTHYKTVLFVVRKFKLKFIFT